MVNETLVLNGADVFLRGQRVLVHQESVHEQLCIPALRHCVCGLRVVYIKHLSCIQFLGW